MMPACPPRALRHFRLAALTSLPLLALAALMFLFYPPALPTLPAGFITPILALEFTDSLEAARALLGNDAALIARVQTGHWIDMGFLLSYGAFLALANLGCWYWQPRPVSLAGLVLALLAAGADSLENGQLLHLGRALLEDTAAPDFGLLRLCVVTKFAAIALSLLCLVPRLRPANGPGKLFGLVSIALALVTLPALTLSLVNPASAPPLLEIMGVLIVPGWILLLVWLVRAPRRLGS